MQLGSFNLSHSPTLPLQVTVKHRVVKFQEMSLSKGQMAMEGKTLREGTLWKIINCLECASLLPINCLSKCNSMMTLGFKGLLVCHPATHAAGPYKDIVRALKIAPIV